MRLDQTLARLHKAGICLADRQGRVARRNARRKFLAALNAARAAVEQQYPLLQSPRPDRIEQAAESMDWHDFQCDVIKNISRRWDKDFAKEFVAFVSDRLALSGNAVLLDLQSPCRWLADRALPVPSPWVEWNRGRWMCLFHELAHCRRSGHRRAFVRELSVIYRLWLEFLADHRKRQCADRSATRCGARIQDTPITAHLPAPLEPPQKSDAAPARRLLVAACQSPMTDLISVLRRRVSSQQCGQPEI
jgi:hypothetical protein